MPILRLAYPVDTLSARCAPALLVLLVACSSAASGATGGELGDGATPRDSAAEAGSMAIVDGEGPETADATGEVGSPVADASGDDASVADTGDARGQEGGEGGCEVFGAPGACIAVSACAAMADHSSYAGHCAGPATVECCIDTPDVNDNPPVPAGWMLMPQAQVTAPMTTWAVMILNDPIGYPMFSTTIQAFGTQTVLARVEWHPPDFQNAVVHRGVTLYIP